MKRSATSALVALLPNLAYTVPLRAISISIGIGVHRAPSAGFWPLERVGSDDPLLGQLESKQHRWGWKEFRHRSCYAEQTGLPGRDSLRTPLGRKPDLINRTPSIGVPRRVGPCDRAHLEDAAAALVARQGHVLHPSDPVHSPASAARRTSSGGLGQRKLRL
jgi:hypothetical protein